MCLTGWPPAAHSQVRAAFASVPSMVMRVPEGSRAAELGEEQLAEEIGLRIQRARSMAAARSRSRRSGGGSSYASAYPVPSSSAIAAKSRPYT